MGKGIRSTICACAVALLAAGALVVQGRDPLAAPAPRQTAVSAGQATVQTHPSLKNKALGPQPKAVARAPLPRDPASLKAAGAKSDRSASVPAPVAGGRAGTPSGTPPRAASFN